MGSLVYGVALVVLVQASALGNGFRNPPATAGGLGRDGGRVAHTEDASAAEVNPAQLAGQGAGLMLSLSAIRAETEFESMLGSAETDDPWKWLPNVFAALPLGDERLVLGLALTTPFGQSTVWDEAGAFRYAAPYKAELSVINANPSLGFQVTDRLALGAGLDVFYSELSIRQLMPWSLRVPGAADGRMRFDGDGTGAGWNAGLRMDLTEQQRLALAYRSRVKVDYDGDFEVSGTPAPVAAAGLGGASDFESEIEFPASVVIGYGIDVTGQLEVGVDVEWIEFSTYDSLPVDIGVNNALLPANSIPQDWDDIWTFGVGAAWRVCEGWTLRCGYKYMPSPVPEETLAPSLPDADKHQVSLGLGYAWSSQRLDVGYAYAFLDDRTVAANLNPAFNGEYASTSHILALTYGYSF